MRKEQSSSFIMARGAAILVALFAATAPAQAAVTLKDIQVAGRVIGFIDPAPSGTLKLGIVYDPSNAASTADEQALAKILGDGFTVSGLTLVPEPVPIANVSHTDVDMLFLTGGLGSPGAAAGKVASTRKILCVTTDLAATRAGICAVAVQSSPEVQIILNRAALSASGISFDSAFMLLVTEI